MSKSKNLFKKIAVSFALLGTLTTGAFFISDSEVSTDKFASAAFSEYKEISNNLPEYMDITISSTTSGDIGRVDDIVYLFQQDSTKNIIIGNDEISSSANEDKKHFAYIPENGLVDEVTKRPLEYYYFDFQTSISLYYNLTSEDVQNNITAENLLQDESMSDFTDEHEDPFDIVGYSFSPKKLDLQFKLNTSEEKTSTEGHVVTLSKEGCYTLAIPIYIYKTENDGITFSYEATTIYYNFMIFNADTYFDTLTDRPNIKPSLNMQESTINSSTAYSNYYFYNFAYGQSINSLPSISYNPNRFELFVSYTDIDQKSYNSKIECNNGVISQLDENGNIISEKEKFIETNIDNDGDAVVTFTKLGSYDISISYLYVANINGKETVYSVPLEKLNNDLFKNKSQKLYMYGYQAVYSDYENINLETNQPESKELKSFDFENGIYENSADITSAVNNYIIKNGTDEDKTNAKLQNPSKTGNYEINDLKEYASKYINQEGIEAVSSNQTPIKFITNAQPKPEYSNIYKVNSIETKDPETGKTIKTKELSWKEKFSGFNQNTAGTYVYIIQYTFDSFMSTSGTLQSGAYHYQIFYFTITNSTPTITIYDSEFSEIYTGGYTNKSVYILNDAENNMYDAKVDITVSAYDYTKKTYFFPETDITNLSQYGMTYQTFDSAHDPLISGKHGIIIDNRSDYANALFTVNIKSANSDIPSTRTFTIDTNDIDGITSRNASISSSTSYKITSNFTSYASNQPFVLSWNKKDSGAETYGFVKYIPMQQINYYSSLNQDKLADLLSRLISHETLPVSYKLDIANSSAWTEYSNSYDFNNIVPSTYVKSNDGIYILGIYDQAGNNSFSVFMKDSTSPVFIEEIVGDTTIRKIISNSESISVPEKGIEITINWAKNKAVFIENVDSYKDITAYRYGIDTESANKNLQDTLAMFFETQNNNSLKNINDIHVQTTKENDIEGYPSTGITSYNGLYLIIPIENKAYIKDALSSEFSPYENTSYKIRFLDDNDKAIEGTYKILIRDASNSQSYTNEAQTYKLHPSGYLSFNVTSDASKMMVQFEDGELLDYSSFSTSGNLYSYEDDKNVTHYTHKIDNGLDINDPNYQEYKESSLTYKFSYHTPINGDRELALSYIPVAENGSKLDSIILKYYPYELTYEKYQNNPNYYYYYKIASTPTRTINVFTKSDKTYDPDQVETFSIALGTDSFPLAGRYIIERTYVSGNTTDKYDYFKRTISFTVDNFNLISPLEGVTTPDGTNASLESVVGGDILLSMYSGENLSTFEVSFPSYNSNGLSSGSFYSKESFDEGDSLAVFAVEGNKLPVSLYIPQHKYTISTNRQENSKGQVEYGVNSNNDLSYYGFATYKQNVYTGMYDVYVEGVVIDSFGTAEAAQRYINNYISIAEYKIFVEVEFTPIVNNKPGTPLYYYSNGNGNNGYLNLYKADSKNGKIDENAPVEFFYQKGNYVVTIYQASNMGPTSNFYSSYKFGFKIISQEPDFTIYGSDGYQLTEAKNAENVYYTNSDMLTIEWQVPTSKYQAQIDEENISIRYTPSTAIADGIVDIKDGSGTRYFTVNTSKLILVDNSYLEITMRFEGHNSSYGYKEITKRIYFDRSAPSQNIVNLMSLTESATKSAFPINYQQYYMRKYYDYKNQEISINNLDLQHTSYSYSIDNGYFKYFSYNVTKEFFIRTLRQTIMDAAKYPYETQYIYYKPVSNIDSYTQVDKSSFSPGNQYSEIFVEEEPEVACGYYEIVELDYAGNMTVYLVYLVDSTLEEDANVRTDALTYFNSTHTETTTIKNDQIINGFNIYSNSGFEITDLNYKSDPWALLNVSLSGGLNTRYMKSPWLQENEIYKVSFTASGISFEQISMSKMFDGIDSSSAKHQLIFTDRLTGTNTLVYLSIMDASINTQKQEDPNKTSAILNISIPTVQQQQSSTTSYAFPVSIVIKQYDKYSTSGDGWNTIMIANQQGYGNWVPETKYASVDYISFKNVTATTLQVAINLGVNASQKVKYEILDNFGNWTTVIQLANEVSYKEISGQSDIYQSTENDGSVTYTSSQTIKYSFNTLLYNVEIYNKEGENITDIIKYDDNATTNIAVYSFEPSNNKIYDNYYKIVVTDSELENDPDPKVIHIRIVYNLPYLTFVANEVHSGGLIFNDKNQQPIAEKYIKNVSSMSVSFNGKTYTSSGYAITTYSQNVTLRFKNGQDYAFAGSHTYQDGYSYSLYLSRDNGQTWENINSSSSAINGHTISGVGDYLILAKYDSIDKFTNLCKIFSLSILDSASSYYSITVDGIEVEKSDIKYKSPVTNYEYEINYIVSVDWADKDNRLTITENEELGVQITLLNDESTGSLVHVEIYHYESESGVAGDFTIIYIEETNNVVSTFTYDTAAGTNVALKDSSYKMVVATKGTEDNFNKLKLNFSSSYGISENKVKAEVLKLFNGNYVKIDCKVYQDTDYSYILLERAGSYRIKLYDSCTPANVQSFKGNEYIDIVFLSTVPFTLSHVDENGETVVTEPVQKAIYNNDVMIELSNLYNDSYYQPSGYPVISVKLNGVEYTGYTMENRKYKFTEPGFYTIKFSATSKTGIQVHEEEYNFSIIKKNELRYAYEFTQFSKYYIEKVEREGVDITEQLINYGNFSTVLIDGKTYLSSLSINHSLQDEKTGDGRYKITINPNSPAYSNVVGDNYTFEIRIGYAKDLPINISVSEGKSTSDDIVISFNVQNLYNVVGDCYIKVAGITRYYTSETLADYNEIDTITITGSGTHYVQLYTLSGRPLYSYKVIKTDPLNAFAIIAIIIGVIAVGAVIGITISIRKRQKVK